MASFPSGLSLGLDLRDRTQAIMYCGTYELFESRLLNDLLGSGDVFVDIGAHVGWFTVRAAQRIGSTGTVYAFEPYPPNAESLRANVTRNSLENVRISAVALSDNRGTVRIARHADSDSASATVGLTTGSDAFDVTTNRLDDLVPEGASPALIKIDVEGLEESVLEGAVQTLRRTRAVLVEISTDQQSGERVTTRLRSLGFERFDQLPSGRAFGRSCGAHINVLARRVP